MLKVNSAKLKEIRFLIDEESNCNDNHIDFKCVFNLDSTIKIFEKEESYSRHNFEMEIPVEMGKESREILIGLWYQMQDELRGVVNGNKEMQHL